MRIFIKYLSGCFIRCRYFMLNDFYPVNCLIHGRLFIYTFLIIGFLLQVCDVLKLAFHCSSPQYIPQLFMLYKWTFGLLVNLYLFSGHVTISPSDPLQNIYWKTNISVYTSSVNSFFSIYQKLYTILCPLNMSIRKIIWRYVEWEKNRAS